MLRRRVLTGLIGAPVLLLITYAGGPPFLFAAVLLAVLAYVEAARLLGLGGGDGELLFGLLGLAVWFLPVSLGYPGLLPGLVAGYLGLLFLRQIVRYPEVRTGTTAFLFLAPAYAGLTCAHLPALRSLADGLAWTLLAIFLTWTYDITAYFAGKAYGRHKLAPRLSPGKSWEGAIAGATATLMFSLIEFPFWPAGRPLRLLAAALVVIAGQCGDLFESSLKRFSGVKDSGGLLPGHGGVLDRFDSLLFVVPSIYYLVLLWPAAGGR